MKGYRILTFTNTLSLEEWSIYRRKGIGGSDAGAICGVSKWKSPIRVYLDKIGQEVTQEDTEAIYWGKKLEPIIAEEFSRRTGFSVEPLPAILQHVTHDFILGNIDGILHHPEKSQGVLECKTTNEYMKEEWKEEKVPDAYYIQVQHYLAVTGFSYGYIAALIGGNKFKYYYIERDEEFINYLVQIEEKFWKRVQDKNPPPPDGSRDTSKVLQFLYPKEELGIQIHLEEMQEKLNELQNIKALQKELEQRRAQLEQEFKLKMGPVGTAYIADKKLLWQTVHGAKFDINAFKQTYPDLYTHYLKPIEYRRFTIR